MESHVLRDIYLKYGQDAVFEPKRLRAYLLDMHVPRRTVNLLADISKIDYFRQFAVEVENDANAREKLIYSVEDEYAFDTSAVKYGVDCWVYAFTGKKIENGKYISDDDVNPFDKEIWSEEKAELVAAALRELMG